MRVTLVFPRSSRVEPPFSKTDKLTTGRIGHDSLITHHDEEEKVKSVKKMSKLEKVMSVKKMIKLEKVMSVKNMILNPKP